MGRRTPRHGRGQRPAVAPVIAPVVAALAVVAAVVAALVGLPAAPAAAAPSPTSVAGGGAPTRAAVRDARFVRTVTLGTMTVAPPGRTGTVALGLDWRQARALLGSTDEVAGVRRAAVLGIGRVTLVGIRRPGLPVLRHRLAWVGIVWGGADGCPPLPPGDAVPGPPQATAVVFYGGRGDAALAYTEAGAPPCSTYRVPATLGVAHERLSVPWQLTAAVSDGTVSYRYLASVCAAEDSESLSRPGRGPATIEVDVSVPRRRSGCDAQVWRPGSLPLGPPANLPGQPTPPVPGVPLHAPTGPVPTLYLTGVSGRP